MLTLEHTHGFTQVRTRAPSPKQDPRSRLFQEGTQVGEVLEVKTARISSFVSSAPPSIPLQAPGPSPGLAIPSTLRAALFPRSATLVLQFPPRLRALQDGGPRKFRALGKALPRPAARADPVRVEGWSQTRAAGSCVMKPRKRKPKGHLEQIHQRTPLQSRSVY